MDNPAVEIDEKEKSCVSPPSATTEPSIQDVPIVLYRRRWVILAIFSLISMMNEVIWISLSSVSNVVRDYYRISYHSVNWLATVFSALYFTVIFAVFILNKYGLKITIIGGALMNAIGSGLRLIGYRRNGFMCVFIGNIFGGVGQSFLAFIPPTLSAVWFGEKERARASAIGMAMNMLGVAVGFLMGSMFVPNSKDYDGDVKHGMFNTLLIQAVVCGVLLIASVIFIQKEPATPPTYTQAIAIRRRSTKLEMRKQSKVDKNKNYIKNGSSQEQSTGFSKNWRSLLTNVSFHLLTQAFGIYFALFVTCSTLLNQMTTQHFPGNVKLIGIMGFTSVLFGLVSMVLAGAWIDKTRRYKFIAVVIFGACSLSSLTFTLVLKYSHNFALTFICYCVHGFCSFPYLAVGLEFIAEIMYPVKESILSFISLFLGTMYGVIFINCLGTVTHEMGSEVAGYIIVCVYVLGCVCVSFVNGELKRYYLDSMKNKEIDIPVISIDMVA